MSYCRWSSDWFQCDVYVYHSTGNYWSTNVAGRRIKHPLPPSVTEAPLRNANDWLAAHKAYDEWRDSLPKDKYGDVADSEYLDLATIGDEAGESYEDATPGECADRLEALKAKGFNVPQYAIDELREEAAEP